jgi:hypothetical protein
MRDTAGPYNLKLLHDRRAAELGCKRRSYRPLDSIRASAAFVACHGLRRESDGRHLRRPSIASS